MKPEVNLRALRDEAEWLPQTLEDVVIIRRTLVQAGCSRQQTDGIVGWLVTKTSGQEDMTGSETRSTYRKVLAGLKSPLRSSLRAHTSVAHIIAA